MAGIAKLSREEFAKENYPDLSKHNNIMASNLTFEVSLQSLILQYKVVHCDSRNDRDVLWLRGLFVAKDEEHKNKQVF